MFVQLYCCVNAVISALASHLLFSMCFDVCECSQLLMTKHVYGRLHALGQVMVDTSGWAFAYPLARLAGVRVAAYVHYPTISADMLAAVAARRPGFNNDPALAASFVRSAAKLAYYYVFAAAYGAAGGCANVRTLWSWMCQ